MKTLGPMSCKLDFHLLILAGVLWFSEIYCFKHVRPFGENTKENQSHSES